MKKVLFATTALVATASVAAADVNFSGYGRFGLLYSDVGGVSSTNLTTRLRLQIDMTAESDSGVEFGARARIQQNTGGTNTGINGVRFFARTGGFEVGAGNIFGAIEWMPGQYPIDLGLTGLGYNYTAYGFNADAYSSGGVGAGGSNGVEVMYSAGDFSVHVSASDTSDRIAGYASYSFSGWTVAVGVQDSTNAADTEWTATIGGSLGVADITLAYADNGTSGERFVLAGKFDIGASTNIEAYYADDTAGDSYGIDFNHSLGGGTSVRGGIAELISGETRADLGIRFNF